MRFEKLKKEKIENDNLEKDSEEELSEKYHRLDEIKIKLYKKLKKLVIETGVGEISDDYTKTVTFYLGDITIYSDPYYNQLDIESPDCGEMNLDHDLETTEKIYQEVKKRYKKLINSEESRRIKNKAEEIFEKKFKILNPNRIY